MLARGQCHVCSARYSMPSNKGLKLCLRNLILLPSVSGTDADIDFIWSSLAAGKNLTQTLDTGAESFAHPQTLGQTKAHTLQHSALPLEPVCG